jgi:hypothetical protein
MKITSLTKERGETTAGNVVEISGGLPELFNYFRRKVDWPRFLRGFRRPGVEKQYFRTVADGVTITVIIGKE